MVCLMTFTSFVRLVGALVLPLASGIPAVLGAQGTVSGIVSIVEPPDMRTNDLANAVVWLEPVESKGLGPTPGAGIVMESRTFVPRVRVVQTGSTVTFPNQDPFRHNVFSKSGPSEFDLGLYGRGQSRGAKFDRPGVYPVFCNIHARMLAFVVAVATPHVTQAGSDGRFTLAGVPAGRYTMHVWHDRGGQLAHELDVGSGGASNLTVRLDARNYKLVQHRNKFGQEYTTTGRERY